MDRILTLFFFLIVMQLQAQFFEGDAKTSHHQGFFDFHYQENEDKIFLVIKELDKEFLYVNALTEGLGSNDIGLDRGQLGGGEVVKWIKSGNKLLLVQPNQRYRAETTDPLEKASVREAFAKSVLFGATIEEEKNGAYLVDITPFLIRDAHGVSRRLASNDQGNYSLDKTRSSIRLERTKAFPKNVEFDALLTFKGKPKGYEIRSVSPDASAVSVYQHHSFVELPDNGYQPRDFDPRAGSFPMTYMDYASPVNESIHKKLIYRHRLKKKNPNAETSEPVEPIIYYLDPGTPEPIRTALLEGARWWNQAFEAAGYINAFQVEMLPAGADPLDLRYNVIQWVHRSTRGWSYGGSISDPRTGEIIKGHVSLGSLRIRQDYMIAQALQAAFGDERNDEFAMEMALARIRQLSAHEVGHTLGFAHNFAASTVNRSSVMDYPHPQIRLTNGALDFSKAYEVGIGSWDKVAVSYAYQDFGDTADPSDALNELLNKAFQDGHRFLSDSDARPAGSASAHAHLWDNGEDLAVELEEVLKVRDFAIKNFSTDNIPAGRTYTELEDVFVPLYFFHRYQTEAVAKLLGGLEYNYAVKGGEPLMNQPVSASEQKKALETVLKTVSVENLALSADIRRIFPPRAYGQWRSRESFKSNLGPVFDPFGAASTAAAYSFSFVLHPERAGRIYYQQKQDKKQLGLSNMLKTIQQQTFGRSHKDSYLQEVQNSINEQYLEHLFLLARSSKTVSPVQAVVEDHLKQLKASLTQTIKDADQLAINRMIVQRIDGFLKNPKSYSPLPTPKIPDGSPIGN